jgi:putative transposase
MRRPKRAANGGLIYHVLNGANARRTIFEDDVERNALRANLAPVAERWRWGGLQRWKHGTAKKRPLLAAWPLPRWPDCVEYINGPQTAAALARSVVACNAAVRSAKELGATRSSADWEWTARYAPKAAPKSEKTVPDTFSGPRR